MSKAYTPRPHQEPMHAHLAALRKAALHAGCGSGKTVVVGTHVAESLFDRMDTERWLIVAPKSVAEDTWHREFEKWRHLEHIKPRLLDFEDLQMRASEVDDVVETEDDIIAVRRRGGLEFDTRKETKKRIRGYAEPVHVCSYQTFPWIVSATGVNFPYQGIVFDEAGFLRNEESERCKAAKLAVNKLGLVSDVIELDGTPIPRGYEDLRAPFLLLDKGLRLGRTKTEFRDEWCEPDKRGYGGRVFSWKVRDSKLPQIQAKIGELAVSTDRDIGVALVESDHMITMPAPARELYEQMREELLIEIDGQEVLSANAAVLVNKLLQICNGSVIDVNGKPHLVHDAKIEAMAQAIEASPTPVLLPYPFKADERALRARLGRRMRLANEAGAKDAFRAGDVHCLAFHPDSMSHGIDGLQGASNTVLWFGATHRWDWYFQIYKRLHRDGQEKEAVFVRRFIMDQTIELGIVHEILMPRGAANDGLLKAIRPKGVTP